MPRLETTMNPADRPTHLRSFRGNTAWREILLPALDDQRRSVITQLIDPSIARKNERPDDYLRGILHALAWIETLPERELQRSIRRTAEDDDDVDGGFTGL